MSIEKNRAEGLRWLLTAEDDLEAAKILKKNGKFSFACFHAQQTAEKAVKAIYYLFDKEPRGHSIVKLLQGLVKQYSHLNKKKLGLMSKARRLDQFYIPTRYPNGVPDMTPAEAFGEEDAKNGILYAQTFINAVKKCFITL